FSEERVHQGIIKEKVTIASVVTVMVQRLIGSLENQIYPESLRCMFLGGGPAPKPLLEKAKQVTIPVCQSYGMTEATSQIVTLSPDDVLQKLGSAGKPLFPGQLQIKNQDDDNVGEIFVKGPMVSNEYFNNNVANEETFQD